MNTKYFSGAATLANCPVITSGISHPNLIVKLSFALRRSQGAGRALPACAQGPFWVRQVDSAGL